MKNEPVNGFTHRLMKRHSLSLSLLALPGAVVAPPIAGVDFSSGGSFNPLPDELVAGDGITVGDWIFEGGASIVGDNHVHAGRASAPMGKFHKPLFSPMYFAQPGFPRPFRQGKFPVV